jgi:uncharacterized membrane protein YbhN (UPF0104 family)
VYKINSSSPIESLQKVELINPSLIIAVMLLMVFNWGLETKKWQILIQNIEPLSLVNAFKSVLAGLSSGLLTPNRVGNFIGRITYVKREYHNQAIINTLVGNLAQFISTILFGFIGVLFLLWNKFQIENSLLIIILSGIIMSFGCYVYFKPVVVDFYPLNKLLSNKTKLSIEQISSSKPIIKVKVLVLSILRYFVFCIQYLLLFKAFGLLISPFVLLSLIATVFLITTLLPSLLFGKLFIRESVAVFIFSLSYIDVSMTLVVAFLLWLINLAIPSVLGSVFWLKRKDYV